MKTATTHISKSDLPTTTPTVSIRHRAVRGMLWMLSQTIGGRVIALASQVILARLLAREDFGQVGLTYTISAFVSLVGTPGLESILAHRRKQLEKWIAPSLVVAIIGGILCSALLVAASPLAAMLYDDKVVSHLLLILACGAPFAALNAVPNAILVSQMRFRAIATIGLLGTLLTSVLTLLLAYLDFGATSFVLPIPIVNGVLLFLNWRLAAPKIGTGVRRRRLKRILQDCGEMVVVRAMTTLNAQADYIALGLLSTTSVVGIYFFAFSLASQTLRLIGGSICSALLPALSAVGAEKRDIFQPTSRALRLLTLVVFPACAAQAILAPTAMRLIFPEKWAASIPVVQILTIGLMMDVPSWVGSAYLQANGRFRRMRNLSLVFSPIFFSFVIVGAWLGEAVGTAAALATYYAIGTPTWLSLVLSESIPAQSWRFVMNLYARAMLVAIATVAPTILLSLFCRMPNDVVYFAVNLPLITVSYLIVVQIVAPDERRELHRLLLQRGKNLAC